jgi:hypothetical protein
MRVSLNYKMCKELPIYQDLSSNKFATIFLAISRISAGVHERLSFIFVFFDRIWIKQKATLKT